MEGLPGSDAYPRESVGSEQNEGREAGPGGAGDHVALSGN